MRRRPVKPQVRNIILTAICFAAAAGMVVAVCALMLYTAPAANINALEAVPVTSESSASDSPTAGLNNPDREIRGVFIATVSNINFPSKAGLSANELRDELVDIVKTAEQTGLNAIYFQARPSSDALYKSDIFPTSKFLTGKQGDPLADGFDPLKFLVELAHNSGIEVHAWVNPLRITTGSATNKMHDTGALAANNPARLHPEWTVPYADGKLYYNAGIPEVRSLIADGVRELVSGYDIDGVVFDDYFYPYPVSGEEFDDEATYKKYGGDYENIGDFRRDNINKIVELCYKAVKETDSSCSFGVAPFGIWQNDNGKNGGSATKGFNAYSSIYCDAKAWIDGGYIDYIAPQLYWTFSSKEAPFATLVRWWNEQLEGSNVKLLVSHADYRTSEWKDGEEIANQVAFARQEKYYVGSIHYGYAAIKENVLGIADRLGEIHSEYRAYTAEYSNGRELSVNSPKSGSTVGYDSTYILGSSDPSEPLYFEGKPVGRTREGYFSLYVDLDVGENVFTFKYKGEDVKYKIKRTKAAGGTTYATLSEFALTGISPIDRYIASAGEKVTLKATAPSGCEVTATVGGKSVTLKPTVKPPETSGKYMKEIYTGTFTLPDVAGAGETAKLGKIEFVAKKSGKTVSATGAEVFVLGKDAYIALEVINDGALLKTTPTSNYYESLTPAVAGMRDYAVKLENGVCKLRCGYYLDTDEIKVLTGIAIPLAEVSVSSVKCNEEASVLTFSSGDNIPVDIEVSNGKLIITMFNAKTNGKGMNEEFSIFTGMTVKQDGNNVKYTLKLAKEDGFYGIKYKYGYGKIIFTVRESPKLTEGALPLLGKTIVLDAGHGGEDSGASGPDANLNEDDLNLAIVLAAAEKLKALGGDIVLTRSADETLDIYARLDMIDELEPDLCISVHQNSMEYSTDIRGIRGTLCLYCSPTGKRLSEIMSESVSGSLIRYGREAQSARLAMVRNIKFPSTLVEVGFMTSVEEFNAMAGAAETGIEKAADGIVKGILKFFKQ